MNDFNGVGASGSLSSGSINRSPSSSYASSGSHVSLRESVNPPLRESGEQRIMSVPLSNQILQSSTQDVRVSYLHLGEAKTRAYYTDTSHPSGNTNVSRGRNEPNDVSTGMPSSKSPPPVGRCQEPMCVEWDKISKQSAVLAERMDYSRARNSVIPNIASWRDDNQKRDAEVASLRALVRANVHEKSPPSVAPGEQNFKSQYLRTMTGCAASPDVHTTSYQQSYRYVQHQFQIESTMVSSEI
jgi:hypothetical protein